MRTYTHIEMHASGRPDPTKTRILCEAGCGKEILMSEAHSIVAVSYATRGLRPNGSLPSFQCPEEQHFCCSPECMIAAVNVCMQEHLLPLHTAHLAALEAGQA